MIKQSASLLLGLLFSASISQEVKAMESAISLKNSYAMASKNRRSSRSKFLPSPVNWADLTIHGGYRRYKIDTAKGDQLRAHTGLKDGTDAEKYFEINPRYLRNGYEIPTPGYRIPLTIQANNDDTRLGLYSVHNRGTSFIFPKAYTGYAGRLKDGDIRRYTAGRYLAIQTNSPTVTLNYQLLPQTATGGRAGAGLDVYEMDDKHNVTFKENLLRNADKTGSVTYQTGASGSSTKKLIFLLPSYNGFVDLSLAFAKGSKSMEFEPYGESKRPPILVYGTSIDQGDGANGLRPGLTMWSRVRHATQREVINLGVAGSAQLEYKMADFLSNIQASLFVINPGWNLTGGNFSDHCNNNGAPANISNKEIIDRVVYMVKTYRARNPRTPILIMAQLTKQSDKGKLTTDVAKIPEVDPSINPDGYFYSRESALLKTAYVKAIKEGVKNIYFFDQQITQKVMDNNKQNFPDFINNAGGLHYGEVGMLDSANFILRSVKEFAPQIYNGPIPIKGE